MKFIKGLSRMLWRREPADAVEIHIPISPNRHFFTMLHYFCASLREHGGKLSTSRVVVTVGEDREPYDLYAENPWARGYNLEWRWLDRALYRQHIYYATANERFRYRYSAPIVMMADADTLILGDLSDVVDACRQDHAFAGVIAHVSPFGANRLGSIETTWRKLYNSVGLGEPDFGFEHSGFGIMGKRSEMETRYCPPYFNLGMLISSGDIIERVGATLYTDTAAVERVFKTQFKCQIALTLSLARLRVRIKPLPLRYNFPNDDRFAQAYPAESNDVRLCHYLRRQHEAFDKARDFADYAAVSRFMARTDLQGANLVMRDALKRTHDRVLKDMAAIS